MALNSMGALSLWIVTGVRQDHGHTFDHPLVTSLQFTCMQKKYLAIPQGGYHLPVAKLFKGYHDFKKDQKLAFDPL